MTLTPTRSHGLPRRLGQALCLAVFASVTARAQSDSVHRSSARHYVPIGLFFGAIEEGARIFTPVRLLPLEHPESMHHDFPTLLQLHATEFPLLVWLGNRVGFKLWPTLERYPTLPSTDWPYPEFRAPPDSIQLNQARVAHRSASDAPLPGLRAVVFDGSGLVAFIVDTRGISLAARHMTRTTSMGIEINRADFLRALQRAAPRSGTGLEVVVWSRP